jgi:DNA repair exonuclease SbcCD ATPase subunit
MSRRVLPIATVLLALAPAVALAAPPAAPAAAPAADAPATRAEPDPVGAHAAIAQAEERLAEMDATISVLQDDADKVNAAARQKAHDSVTALKTVRDTYKKEIDGVVAQSRQMTADQLRTARAALEAPYKQFDAAVDADVTQFRLDVAQRKAVVEARLKAEQSYWLGVAADLQTKAADLTAEQRAAIDARIGAVKARAAAAQARLTRLSTATRTAWSALKQGFISSGKILDDAYTSNR